MARLSESSKQVPRIWSPWLARLKLSHQTPPLSPIPWAAPIEPSNTPHPASQPHRKAENRRGSGPPRDRIPGVRGLVTLAPAFRGFGTPHRGCLQIAAPAIFDRRRTGIGVLNITAPRLDFVECPRSLGDVANGQGLREIIPTRALTQGDFHRCRQTRWLVRTPRIPKSIGLKDIECSL